MDYAKSIAIILAAFVGALTLIKAVYEYTRQTAQKRAEEFFKLDKQFKENESFSVMFGLLETDSVELQDIEFEKKIKFLGFYEKIALMVNSGLMRQHVAYYMFSYYAIRCWGSDNFWSGVDRESPYWALFVHFVNKMKAVESSFTFKPSDYKL